MQEIKLWFTKENLLWGARLGKTWVHAGTGWYAEMKLSMETTLLPALTLRSRYSRSFFSWR